MRTLLVLLWLLIYLPSIAQHSNKGHENHIIDNRVDSIISSIQKRGVDRGYDLKSALKQLPTKNNYPVEWWYNIKIKDSIYGDCAVIGRVIWETHWTMTKKWHYHPMIEIETYLFDDSFLVEQTLAHELGHILGIKHKCRNEISDGIIRQDCFNIMSPIQNILIPGTMYYKIIYNSSESEKIWDLYFTKLKKLQNKN